jgi:hypothetical protein
LHLTTPFQQYIAYDTYWWMGLKWITGGYYEGHRYLVQSYAAIIREIIKGGSKKTREPFRPRAGKFVISYLLNVNQNFWLRQRDDP